MKWWRKVRRLVAGERMRDERLVGALDVPDAHPVLEGLLEIVARVETRALGKAMDGRTEREQLDGCAELRALDEVRRQVAAVRAEAGERRNVKGE